MGRAKPKQRQKLLKIHTEKHPHENLHKWLICKTSVLLGQRVVLNRRLCVRSQGRMRSISIFTIDECCLVLNQTLLFMFCGVQVTAPTHATKGQNGLEEK
jgi:hypothetical protein